MPRNSSAQSPQFKRGIVPQIDIHRRLRIARDMFDSSISQDDFGVLIGASGNTVGNYETGATSRVKDIYIQKWAEVTGIDYWWLKTGKSPDGPDHATEDYQDDVLGELIRVDFSRERFGLSA